MSNKSSIEWLFEQIARRQGSIFQTIPFYNDNCDLIQQAKEMHKEEIIEAFSLGDNQQGFENEAVDYYNITFGK